MLLLFGPLEFLLARRLDETQISPFFPVTPQTCAFWLPSSFSSREKRLLPTSAHIQSAFFPWACTPAIRLLRDVHVRKAGRPHWGIFGHFEEETRSGRYKEENRSGTFLRIPEKPKSTIQINVFLPLRRSCCAEVRPFTLLVETTSLPPPLSSEQLDIHL